MILDKILTNKTKIKVLRTLYILDREVSNPELAKSLDLSTMSISRIISDFSKIGIVISTKKGNSIFSKINKGNYLADFLKYIFASERDIEEGLKKIIGNNVYEMYKKRNIVSVILFGSRARGENKIESDFDIMVIVKNTKKEVKNVEILGFNVSIFVISSEEFIEKLNKKDPFIGNVYFDGEILRGKKEYGKIIQKSKF